MSTVGSGSVTKSPNQTTYASGTNVTLTATAAAGFQFTGWSGAATGTANPLVVAMTGNKAITATFSAVPAGQSVTSFTLVNADTDLDLQTLATGATLNLATLPTANLNIRANTNPATVGSVVFNLSGPQPIVHTESVAPYALGSDLNGDYTPWTPAVGSYTLVATPYTAANAGGTAGTARSIAFTVTNVAARLAAASAAGLPGSDPAVAYPNPSGDGRFRLQMPRAFQGEVRYRLVSMLGATVAAGTLKAEGGGAAQPLDFSRVMTGTGLYYLLLDNQKRSTQLKLTRE